MCDYSLSGIQSRLAREGEVLMVHRFPSGSKGLVSPAELRNCADESGQDAARAQFRSALARWWNGRLGASAPAVCIPPGAQLVLRDIPQPLQEQLDVGAEEHVTFTQLSANSHEYRDAVRFADGTELLLQKLTAGQRVDVLSLAPADTAQEETFAERQSSAV